MTPLLLFGAAYLMGAIPTSYLAGRLGRGIDLRQHGSGNLGATNTYRVLGWKYALPVGVFDIAKGTIPVVLFGAWAGGGELMPVLMGLAAVLGHVFSVFVGFKGGKGVATGAGVILGIAPWAFLVAAAVWTLLVVTTGYVSLGSISGAAVFPPAVFVLHPGHRSTIWVDVLLALLVIGLHTQNIRRLRDGTESRFGRPLSVTGSPTGDANP